MEDDKVMKYTFVWFSLGAIGYLIFMYTGTEQYDIKPDFWAGVFVTGVFLKMADMFFKKKVKSNGKKSITPPKKP
jgi:cytochrome oxidase assembly protein ShyY1